MAWFGEWVGQWLGSWFGTDSSSPTTTHTGTGNVYVGVSAGGTGIRRRANRIDITTAIYPDSRTHAGRGRVAISTHARGRARLRRRHSVVRAGVVAPSPLSACAAHHRRRHHGAGAASVRLDLTAGHGAHHADDAAELLLVLALAELVD